MKEKIIIFGTGVQGEKAYELLSTKHSIACFVDNNSLKWGKMCHGVEIIKPDNIFDFYDENTEIVVAVLVNKSICEQLADMGIKKYVIMINGHIYVGNGKVNQRCSRCLMTNEADDYILFNEEGICNYCTEAIDNIGNIYFPNKEGEERLEELIHKVKCEGKNSKYDCIMGLSGGLDSSYLAYLGYKWGLRVLAIHIDDGYDTEISKSNLNKLIAKTNFDYEVVTPDAEQFNALTLAYIKAGVPNIAVPQDNILFAFLYKKMREYGIKYFFSGGNHALESILQKGHTHDAFDVDNIYDIQKKFGDNSIDKLEFISRGQKALDIENLGIITTRALNYIDYNRSRAFDELESFCGFQYYGRKHLENILTAFIQLYWFPKKFNVDKRTSHLSSMIASGQITRDEAMLELKEPLYDDDIMEQYIRVIAKNNGMTYEQFLELVDIVETHEHSEYSTVSP